MLDAYLEIFYQTCIALAPVIPAVFGIALVLHFIGQLLFAK